MKKIILCLLICCTNVHAQKNQIKWSPVFAYEDFQRFDSVLYDDGQNTWASVYQQEKKDEILPGIIKLNNEMQVEQKEFYHVAQKDIGFDGIYYNGGQFIMLTNYSLKETDEIEVRVTAIDKETLKKKGQEKALLTLPRIRKYKIHFSEDRTHFIIYYEHLNSKQKNKHFIYKVFNSDQNIVLSNDVLLDGEAELINIFNVELSNRGDVLLMMKRYNSSSKKEEEKNDKSEWIPSYSVELIKYGADNGIEKKSIDLNGHLLSSLRTSFDEQNNEMHYMFSLAIPKKNDVIGYYMLNFNVLSNNFKQSVLHKLSPELIAEAKKLEFGFPEAKIGISKDYQITDFDVLNDGRIFSVWEKNFGRTSPATMSNSGTSVLYAGNSIFFSENFIVFMHQKDGEVKWSKVIKKNQSLESRSIYLYHKVMYTKNGITIFYNDRNLPAGTDFEGKAYKAAYFNDVKAMSLVSASFDNDGKLDWKVFFNTSEMGTNIDISKSVLTKHHFYFYGYLLKGLVTYATSFKGERKLGKMDLE